MVVDDIKNLYCEIDKCPRRHQEDQSMCFDHLLEYKGWQFMKDNNIIDNEKHLAQFIRCQHSHCGNLVNVSRYPRYQKRYTSRINQILKMNFELVLMCNAYHGFYKTGVFDVNNPCKCSICIDHLCSVYFGSSSFWNYLLSLGQISVRMDVRNNGRKKQWIVNTKQQVLS